MNLSWLLPVTSISTSQRHGRFFVIEYSVLANILHPHANFPIYQELLATPFSHFFPISLYKVHKLPKMLISFLTLCFMIVASFSGAHSKTITSTITNIIAAPSSPPASSSYTSDNNFRSSILNSTNFYRNQHNATALTWNNSLATYATTYANKCLWTHSVSSSSPPSHSFPSHLPPPFPTARSRRRNPSGRLPKRHRRRRSLGQRTRPVRFQPPHRLQPRHGPLHPAGVENDAHHRLRADGLRGRPGRGSR